MLDLAIYSIFGLLFTFCTSSSSIVISSLGLGDEKTDTDEDAIDEEDISREPHFG